MNATIISIGNELLNGRTINSNSTFMSASLYDVGISTRQVLAIHDEAAQIAASLDRALNDSGIVLLTGGLGPTHDDITVKVIADFLGSPMKYNDAVVKNIEKKFRERGLRMPETNRTQGWLPESALLLDNPVGTAPGLQFEENGKHIFVMPGVPMEMKHMMTGSVIPFLCRTLQLQRFEVRVFRTTRISESGIYERCEGFMKDFADFEIAFLPKFTGVDIRVALPRGSNIAMRMQRFEMLLNEKIGNYIYADNDDNIATVVGKQLNARQMTLAVAESCTGGLIQRRITSVAGSSDYFPGGMVTYSNHSKISLLGIAESTMKQHGAVSESVAAEMAECIKAKHGSDLGLSTTGIAGPGGGTAEKPVGLVYIGLASPSETKVKQFNLGKDRGINQAQTAIFALDMIRRWLNDLPI